MKICSRCRQPKPLDEFALRGPSRPGQRVSDCRCCRKAAKRERDAARASPPPNPAEIRCNNAMIHWPAAPCPAVLGFKL